MSYKPRDLTPEEERAIRALERVVKIWPESLWLFSGAGSLCVMRKDENGERIMRMAGGSESVDCRAVVATIDIDNDGGDW